MEGEDRPVPGALPSGCSCGATWVASPLLTAQFSAETAARAGEKPLVHRSLHREDTSGSGPGGPACVPQPLRRFGEQPAPSTVTLPSSLVRARDLRAVDRRRVLRALGEATSPTTPATLKLPLSRCGAGEMGLTGAACPRSPQVAQGRTSRAWLVQPAPSLSQSLAFQPLGLLRPQRRPEKPRQDAASLKDPEQGAASVPLHPRMYTHHAEAQTGEQQKGRCSVRTVTWETAWGRLRCGAGGPLREVRQQSRQRPGRLPGQSERRSRALRGLG